MRGLTARELECLRVCAGPDLCVVADGEASIEDLGLLAAGDVLRERGVLHIAPCPHDECEGHIYPTDTGRMLLALGAAAVTGGAS